MSLVKRILELSENKTDFGVACLEWKIKQYGHHMKGYRCICGQSTHEVSFISNTKTGKEATVGRCCIERFPMPWLFVSAVRAAWTGRITDYILNWARTYGKITQADHDFLVAYRARQAFDSRQATVARRIYKKIYRALGITEGRFL